MPKPCDFNCIVPSHMLEQLLRSSDVRKRSAALETLLLSEMTREHRATIGRSAHLGGDTLHRSIYDMENRSAAVLLPGRIVRREGEASTADDAVNESYEGLGWTYRFFRDVLGRNSIDGNGMRLDASVHFGEDYLNAFWNGSQMVFGDGDGSIFLRFTKSLDVIAHELAHGVTEHTAGLIYHNQPGALNESFSDVFGSLVKQFAAGQSADEADWLIGDTIIGPDIDGVALRSLKNPGSAYDDSQLGGKDPQPKHMDAFANLPDTRAGDWGGVHINSGIPNHVFYRVARALGGKAWDEAGKIWYATLQALHSNSDFAECAARSIEIAGTLYGAGSEPQQAVSDAWWAVGVTKNGSLPSGKFPAGAEASEAAQALENKLKKLAKALRGAVQAIEDL